jgi:hypothetical protein
MSVDWKPWFAPLAVAVDARLDHPIIKRRDVSPTFDLQALYDDGFRAAIYAVKQGRGSELVSHLDLFDL